MALIINIRTLEDLGYKTWGLKALLIIMGE